IGDWLGIGVANLINLFNPAMVIFGGMLRDVYPAASAQVRARIAINVLPVARERVRLRTSGLADDATLVGAAELGFAPLLTNPQHLPAFDTAATPAHTGTHDSQLLRATTEGT
ncbi:ROK family protein, partial [Dactylosporangium sp. NPDC000521]|uniref:ROK family protein n=1 Tax=Dactylosporangium sp. NPDC000521 TaxID=3363975 RepID=UPI0036B06377